MKQNSNSLPPYYLADNRYSFSLNNLLGKGATGNVYKGHDHRQNRPVAIKVIETGKMNQVEKSLIQNEKHSLKVLKHQNIMKLHHIEEQQDHTFIVSQIYEGGSLKQYIQKKGRLNEQQAMELFRKIILGYCAVVQANIIHRDLKPTNILLTSNNQPVIIDFGYSQIIVANKNLTVFNVGSPSYMSPEAYNKTIYSEKSDVWSLGAIFYQLLMNTTLDNNVPTKQYFQSLASSEYPPINLDLFGEVSKQILKGTLAVRPDQRITSHRIKYLLDKEIIGKKLCSKIVTQGISHQSNINKQSFNNVKSMKNFEFMEKQVDFSKIRAQQQDKNVKRNPIKAKTFSNVAIPLNLNETSSNKIIPPTAVELIQGIIRNESSKGSIERKPQQIGANQRIQSSSVKNTPSISRIDFRQADQSKNAMSSICYAERKHNAGSFNNSSNLVMGSREMSKNMSTIQIYNQSIRNTLTNADTSVGSTVNSDYFNESIQDPKLLTFNEGMYCQPQNKNISLASSVDRKIFIPQNQKPLTFSGQVKAGPTRYVQYQTEYPSSHSNYDMSTFEQNRSSHVIYDFSKNFQRKKSSKRLSIAENFKDKHQSQIAQNPTDGINNNSYENSDSNQVLSAKRNENSQFKLSFKAMTPTNHTDVREGELKNLNRPKRPQNNFQSQNIMNFRQKPQIPKCPDSSVKVYQNNQNVKQNNLNAYHSNQNISHNNQNIYHNNNNSQANYNQKSQYPPKPVSSNYISYGLDRNSYQSHNWMKQGVLQYSNNHTGSHIRNLSETETRNILSLRKIV